MNNKLLLIGGGGHCKSIIDSLIQNQQYSDIGIIDKAECIGNTVLGFEIIGSNNDLEKLFNQGYHYAFVAVGSIGDPTIRIKLFTLLETIGFSIPNIIDPSSNVSKYADLDCGIFIGKNVVINAGTIIDKGAIINTSSSIDHDCRIGKFVHISPGSILCGNVVVGDNTHIGAGSMVKQQVCIGSDTLIGIGSVVLRDIGSSTKAFGNPCREVIS